MKVAPVERSGSWRPGGSDARVSAISRLQSVTSDTAALVTPQSSGSGRELPVVAVKRGADVETRPVLQSDKVKGTDAGLTLSAEFAVEVSAPLLATSTVDAFSKGARAASQVGDAVSGAATNLPTNKSESSQAKARASAAVDAANTTAKRQAEQQRAAEAAASEPPKEPMSKILLDVVQSMWAASRSVVDGAVHKDYSGLPGKVAQGSGIPGVSVAIVSSPQAQGQSSKN